MKRSPDLKPKMSPEDWAECVAAARDILQRLNGLKPDQVIAIVGILAMETIQNMPAGVNRVQTLANFKNVLDRSLAGRPH